MLAGLVACAGPVLRVGTSGDYQPFSVAAADGSLSGLDVELARAFAAASGRRLRLVRFRWSELAADLSDGRFDVVMSGVTVRPDRSLAGRFTRPVVESGALALVREPQRFAATSALDAPGVTVVVNAGGHLERVARARLPRARIVAVPDNAAVPGLLASGQADAAISDTLEAPAWQRLHPGLAALPPFTRDRKAFWLPVGVVGGDGGDGGEGVGGVDGSDASEGLARELDAFLADREASGWLASLRERHLGAGPHPRPAEPVSALLWTLRERLELMPAVAEAKRRGGLAVEAPERERQVLAEAVRAAERAARRRGRAPLSEARLVALFEAQIEASKAIQRAVLAGPPQRPPPAYSLEDELRPALLRIGARVVELAAELPEGTPAGPVRERARELLTLPGLAGAPRDALVEALVALVAPGAEGP